MNNKYIIAISSFIASLLLLSSCQDIDLLPKDNLPDQLFWKTPADFMKEANKLYMSLETFETKDADSDIGFELNENTTSNGTLIAPNNEALWDSTFVNLRQSNTIIEKAVTYEGNASEIEQYVAEARFFRAYVLFQLMQKYNDVPILTTVLNVDSPELYGSRNKQQEVEDFILKELEESYGKLPLQSELGSDETGRVTQGAALALKARVALFAGTWAKYHQHRPDYQQLLDQAVKAANLVIGSGEYKLFEGADGDSYRQLFIEKGDDAVESILASRYFVDIRMHSTGNSVYWGWRGTPTKKLADMYLCKSTGLPISDPASGFKGFATIKDEFDGRDPRMKQTILMPGTKYLSAQIGLDSCVARFSTRPETRTGYKLYKFMGEAFTGVDQSTYDYHTFRYAEVLLILAEATFEKDGAISDDILNKTINVLRSRKGVEMPALTNAFVQAHGLDMQTEIRRERTIELAFEGFRRNDLRRWKTAEVELKEPIRGIKYKGSEYEKLQVLNDGNPGLVDKDGFLIVEPAENRIFVTPKNYYYSVPLDELYLNPNLMPNNPGW